MPQIKLNADVINDWYTISINYPLTSEDIRTNHDKIDWAQVCMHQNLSEDIIREFQDKVSWNYIGLFQTLSDEFIIEFADKLDINHILHNRILKPKTIEYLLLLKG